jgi:hypothetical protein
MLQRTITYSTLLRIVGACFLLFGLYVVAIILTAITTNPDDPIQLYDFLFFGGPFLGNLVLPGSYQSVNLFGFAGPGPLLWVGLGTLCISLTTRRVPVAYLGLQIALWLISASFWDRILWLQRSHYYGLDNGVGTIGPFFLETLALSLVLLALYQPVTRGLRWLMVPSDERTANPRSRASGHLAPS